MFSQSESIDLPNSLNSLIKDQSQTHCNTVLLKYPDHIKAGEIVFKSGQHFEHYSDEIRKQVESNSINRIIDHEVLLCWSEFECYLPSHLHEFLTRYDNGIPLELLRFQICKIKEFKVDKTEASVLINQSIRCSPSHNNVQFYLVTKTFSFQDGFQISCDDQQWHQYLKRELGNMFFIFDKQLNPFAVELYRVKKVNSHTGKLFVDVPSISK